MKKKMAACAALALLVVNGALPPAVFAEATIAEENDADTSKVVASVPPALSQAPTVVGSEQLAVPSTISDFSTQYSALTKQILLSGVEIERYSLNFRLESGKQPRFRRLRYFAAQETGAACGLAFEIAGDQQFGRGRTHPLQINKQTLHGALATAMTGSIVAGSGSALELSSNLLQAIKNKHHGYDHASARKFVSAKLKHIDQLLAQREALVAANTLSPAYERALVEGQILHEMRNCFVNEFSQFSTDTRGYLAFQNAFFLLNAAYNAVGATAAYYAYKGVATPRYNGQANIMFIISGALAMVSPALSVAYGKILKTIEYKALVKEFGEKPGFDQAKIDALCKKMEALRDESEGTLSASLPATKRLAIYTQSEDLFAKQLASETTVMRKLEKVALQTTLLGPAIGAQLMNQGILGTVGYYKYTFQPRKQLNYNLAGSVVGTVGTSMAVVGNAAWLLSSLAYTNRLSREKRLPVQLIKARLAHLDDLEKTVNAM